MSWTPYFDHTGRIEFTPNQPPDDSKPCPQYVSAEDEARSFILELLRIGAARFEVSPSGFSEFCFSGMRYYANKGDWALLMRVIGRDRIQQTIQASGVR
jgi:hypothetical protein